MKKSLSNNIVLLIVLTLLLKVVGFVNRVVIAYYFGTSTQTDIYYIASGFTDSLSAIFLASLTVGIINIYLTNKRKKKNDQFISSLLVICFTGMCIVSLLIFIFSNPISYLLAPSYSGNNIVKLSRILKLLCITFPFQGMIAVYSSMLQAEKNFTPVKLVGTVASAMSVICVVSLAANVGVNALVIAYIAGIVLNTIVLGECTKKFYTFSIRTFGWSTDLYKLGHLIVPLMLGIAAHELNLIIDKSIASGIEPGAISALSYSSILYLFIENVIINSIVTAIFPELTENSLETSGIELAKNTQRVLIFAEIILIPLVICVVGYAEEITKIIYMRGSFDNSSLELTVGALKGYILGLPFLAMRDISMQVFYAYGDTKIPVRINVIAVVINIILDVLLSRRWGIFGITISTAIANMFSGLVLLYRLGKYNNRICDKSMKIEFSKIILANLLITAIIVVVSSRFGNIVFFIGFTIIAFILEFVLLVVFKSVFIKEVLKVCKRKLLNRKSL